MNKNIPIPIIMFLIIFLMIFSMLINAVTGSDNTSGISYDTMLSNAINKASPQITSSEAKTYLSNANSLRLEKKYNDSIISLNKALMVENQADIVNNINKLKKEISSMGLDVSFKSLDDELSLINADIANGDIDKARGDIENIKSDIITYSEDIYNVANASQFIDDTSKLSFWWTEKPNTTLSIKKLNESKKYLSQGDYKSAVDVANNATTLAKTERKIFWNKVKSDSMLNTLYDIDKMFGDPEIYKPKKIETTNFTWKPIQYINIDFSNPNYEQPISTNQETGQEKQETTTLPIKKPINFELDPGNPIGCGTTCRQTTATLTNTGDNTAHNVKINLIIDNNVGENLYSIEEPVGDVTGGQSISKTETINVNCGLFYSKCYGHMPFTLKAEVVYDEGSQTFPDQQFSG